MHTTLNAIREHRPSAYGWAKLLSHLNKTSPDDEPLALTTILESNGLYDAIWALCSLTGHEREIRLFAVACARLVQHLMKDPRSIAALDAAERYANGQCTEEEMSAARKMADEAATCATYVLGELSSTRKMADEAATCTTYFIHAPSSTCVAYAAYAAVNEYAAYAAAHNAAYNAYFADYTADAKAEIQAKQTALFREFFAS